MRSQRVHTHTHTHTHITYRGTRIEMHAIQPRGGLTGGGVFYFITVYFSTAFIVCGVHIIISDQTNRIII